MLQSERKIRIPVIKSNSLEFAVNLIFNISIFFTETPIYDCHLSFMNNIQELDRKSSFIFVGDLNTHHQEWLKSVSFTNFHGFAALDFVNLFGCTQLIKELTHKLGNYMDLLLTNVLGVVDPLVDHPLGNSDHSSISFSVKMGFKITNILFSREVYLKSLVDWPCVGDDLLDNWCVV